MSEQAIDCEQRCEVPEGVALHAVPPPRHAWGDVLRCPNDDCGRCFLVTTPAPQPATNQPHASGAEEDV